MALTLGFVYASSNNYPGAQALLKLHELEPKTNRKPDSFIFAYTLYVEKLKKLAVFFQLHLTLQKVTWLTLDLDFINEISSKMGHRFFFILPVVTSISHKNFKIK